MIGCFKHQDAFHLSVLIQVLDDPKLQQNFKRVLQARFPQTYDYIDNRFLLLAGRKFSEKCYWLMHSLESFPVCPACGEPIKSYDGVFNGYRQTCSVRCGNAYKELKHVKFPYFIPSQKLDEVFRDMLMRMNLDFHSDSFKHAMLKERPYIWNYVYFRYDKLAGHSMPEKIWWFLHEMVDFPRCVTCGDYVTSFKNAALGYSAHCSGCQYTDPEHGKKISQSLKAHRESDPNFLAHKMLKTIETNMKNGHSPAWNNRDKAKHTFEKHLEEDPDLEAKRSQKAKLTNKQRHGDENYNNVCKAKQTCIHKYGVDSFSKTSEFIKKSKATSQKNFGADFVMQSEHGKELYKQSMLESHGVEWPACMDEFKAKWRDEEFVERRQQKINDTKHKNGTFNMSKPEDDSYAMLCEAFGEDDIERQHKDERYPFCCDFYVKSRDLYIECNYHWTHGGHWFDENDPEDIKRLQHLRDKALAKSNEGNKHNLYEIAIKVWTMSDIKKHDTAIINNLNYEVFWTVESLKSYLKDIHGK